MFAAKPSEQTCGGRELAGRGMAWQSSPMSAASGTRCVPSARAMGTRICQPSAPPGLKDTRAAGGLRLLSVPERRRRDSRAARWFVTSRKHTFRETVIDLSPVSSGAKGLRRCPAISRRGVGASANTLLARRLVVGRAAFAPGQEQGQITWQAVLLCAWRQHWLGG